MRTFALYPLLVLLLTTLEQTNYLDILLSSNEDTIKELSIVSNVSTWRTLQSKDEMTGDKTSYAMSSGATSRKTMQFPYAGTTATIGVGCNKNSEWAYIIFSNAPNLLNTTLSNGYNNISTRFKWDENLETMRLIQKWGATSIHFTDDYRNKAINYLIASNNVLIELDWYGENKVYFNVSLSGAGAAINKIRRECASY